MSTTKRCISLLLVLGILLGVFAPAAQAAPVEETATVNTDDVTIEGTNGLGNLLAQEITENQHASETESENYSVGYSVTDLEIVDNMAMVTYESMEDAILIVALHTEDGMQLLNSVSQKVVSDEHEVVIAFDGEMPQYFMASAYLLDTYDLSPLCAAYETPLYTQEMQELLASTVDDYDPEMVLNLDGNDTTNFAVYADSTIVIEPVKGRNTIVTADDEKAVYIFKNVDEQITSLGKGDVFVYPYSEQEILIVKVASIDLDGTTATITGATVEMADVFSYVKIESTAGVADAVVHEGTGDDCVTYHGMKQNGAVMHNQESQIHPNAWEGDLPVASPSFEFGIEETFEDEDGNQITITGGITLEADVSFQYYISLFSQYIRFKADTTLGLHFTVEGKVELFEFELHQVGFDLVPQLVTVSEQPKVQVCINGKIGWEGVMHFSIGLACGHNVPSQDLCSGPWLESKTTLEVGFSVMVDLQPKLSAKATSLLELVGARLTCPAGFEVVAIPNGQSLGDVFGDQGDSIHSCQQCLKFELYGCVELGAEIVFLDNVKLVNKGDGLTIKIPFKAKLKVPILEAYYSTDHKDFGFGSCPYESYRLTIKVLNSENSPEQGTPVYTKWESWGYTNKYGVLETYVPKGTYQVFTTVEGDELCAEIKITGPDYLQFSPERAFSSNDHETDGSPSDDSGNDNWWDEIDFGGIWDGMEDEAEDDSTNWYDDIEFDGGDGTQENPYQVSNAYQLNAVRNDMSAYYIQTADIDLSGWEWEPIGNSPNPDSDYDEESFEGSFDGNGYIISNMTITRISPKNESIGLFGVNEGTLQNINLAGINIDLFIYLECYYANIGGISGTNSGEITNCTVSGDIRSVCDIYIYSEENYQGWNPYQTVGGIVGVGTCSNCTNFADIHVIGQYEIEYMSVHEDCTVTCGGIVGFPGSVNGEIRNCVNYGNIRASADGFALAGGISGQNGSIHNCVNYGDVNSNSMAFESITYHQQSCAGGIVGVTSAYLSSNCVNFGNISATKSCEDSGCTAGGIVGHLGYYQDGQISECYNLGKLIHADITYPEDPDDPTLVDSTTYVGAIHGDGHCLGAENNYTIYSTILTNTNVDCVYGYNGVSLSEYEINLKIKEILLSLELPWDGDTAKGNSGVIVNAIHHGKYETDISDKLSLKTAWFDDLVPGAQYVMLTMVDMDAENPLGADNLLGIAQGTAAEDGTLKFHYIQRFYTEVSYVVVCGASNKNLSDAVITFPEMRADGELHVVEPTVIYGGEILTEGEHYVLVGDVSYTTAGEYTCYVRGIRNYSGLLECSYTVAEHEHSFTNYISDGNATCTEDGTRTAKCDFCYATDTIADVGSALGHTFGVWSTLVEPTCTEDGHEYRMCIRCFHFEGRAISAIGHDMGEWQTTIVATCTENGQELSKCFRCDYNETRVTEATGHSYEAVVTAPTCTEQGYTTYTCHCGDSYVSDYADALGHDMGQWFTVTEATCTADGSERRECSRCDHSETQVIEATGHNHEAVVTEPTCTETGFTTYTCHCGDGYVTDYTDPLGHSFTNYVSDGNATCTQDGTKTAVCDRCDATDTQIDVGSAHGHDFSEWTVVEEPTQTSDGLESRYCYNCGLEETRVISSLENPFTDVPEGSFYHAPVLWAVENGITNGTTATTFGPDDQCMRAHVVTFLWRAAGSPEPESNHNPFVDVKETDFYYKAVLWAVEKGITNGLDATHFGPLTYCNRAQVVTFLWRAQGQPEPSGSDMPFTDVAPGAWYEAPVRWAVANGITNGMSATSFGINVICNRAQIVTFLYRTYN